MLGDVPATYRVEPLSTAQVAASTLIVRVMVSVGRSKIATLAWPAWALEKDVPVSDISTMDEIVAGPVQQGKAVMWLLGSLAGLALALSAVGIYSVISSSVRHRTREIGVRLALGATVGDIHRMILGEGIRLVGIGVVGGGAASLALAGRVGNLIFIGNPRDLLTFTLVPAVLALVGVIACWIPAIRATNIDPSVALRDE